MKLSRSSLFSTLLAAALGVAVPSFAAQGYVQHNLVSDIAGLADRTDSHLVNAWGIVHSATSPWWVNANGTGLSLLYDGSGVPFPTANPRIVTVPPPGATGTSAPTGIVFNGTTDFEVASGKPAAFIFATEDGTISGWNSTVNPTLAILKFTSTNGAVYKGLAIGSMSGHNVLYATDFHNGTVDVFDAHFTPVALAAGAFTDPMVPAGFAPFNVQNVGTALFVTFAKQDAAKHDDVAGPGLGYVDEFSADGTLLMRLKHGHWFNSPWGVAMAPADFGRLSGHLLVGNFGSGQIASFDPANGNFKGMLRGRRGKPITIDGLWGLGFGNGGTAGPVNTLYFSAGIQDEAHGLFGTLLPVKGDLDLDGNDNDEDGNGDAQ
ncbi:MAG: TIGR03118 family protein [Acidobacteriales bacterium]|nr:TIGR03118 family protein [Terriglobales bacterium]